MALCGLLLSSEESAFTPETPTAADRRVSLGDRQGGWAPAWGVPAEPDSPQRPRLTRGSPLPSPALQPLPMLHHAIKSGPCSEEGPQETIPPSRPV